MQKRGMNKKAQEGGASGFTIVGWVILAILLVIVVLAISGFFNPILEKLNLLPGGGISGLVTACEGYASIESKTDYCTFREVKVDGDKEYVNCLDSRVQQDLGAESQTKYVCEDNYRIQTCVSLIKKGVNVMPVVGGSTCNAVECTVLGGEIASSSQDCPVGKSKALAFGFIESSAGTNKCCVAP